MVVLQLYRWEFSDSFQKNSFSIVFSFQNIFVFTQRNFVADFIRLKLNSI